MADLEDRVSELERTCQSILAELGGLSILVGSIDAQLDAHKAQWSTLLNNMAQNSLNLQKRIHALERQVFGNNDG